MNPGIVLSFWVLSLLFVLTPGADWAYAIAGGLQDRARPAVLGLLGGHIAATLLVAAGAGVLIASFPAALTALTIAGSGYLVWMGLGMIRRPIRPLATAGEDGGSWVRWWVRGLGVSGLNPKVFLLFLTLLPQFVSRTGPWSPAAQLAALGVVHVITCAAVYSIVGLCAQVILRARPRVAIWVGRFSGAAMIMVALVLVGERLLGSR